MVGLGEVTKLAPAEAVAEEIKHETVTNSHLLAITSAESLPVISSDPQETLETTDNEGLDVEIQEPLPPANEQLHDASSDDGEKGEQSTTPTTTAAPSPNTLNACIPGQDEKPALAEKKAASTIGTQNETKEQPKVRSSTKKTIVDLPPEIMEKIMQQVRPLNRWDLRRFQIDL